MCNHVPLPGRRRAGVLCAAPGVAWLCCRSRLYTASTLPQEEQCAWRKAHPLELSLQGYVEGGAGHAQR